MLRHVTSSVNCSYIIVSPEEYYQRHHTHTHVTHTDTHPHTHTHTHTRHTHVTHTHAHTPAHTQSCCSDVGHTFVYFCGSCPVWRHQTRIVLIKVIMMRIRILCCSVMYPCCVCAVQMTQHTAHRRHNTLCHVSLLRLLCRRHCMPCRSRRPLGSGATAAASATASTTKGRRWGKGMGLVWVAILLSVLFYVLSWVGLQRERKYWVFGRKKIRIFFTYKWKKHLYQK